MLKNVVAVFALAVSAGAVSAESMTEGESLRPATVIVYRAEERSKTRRINFDTSVGGEHLGRVKYNKPLVSEVAPGEYTFSTSIPGTEAVQMKLQPGQTYYVHAKLRRLGQTTTPELVIVEEQVALDQQPALDGTI